MNKNNPIHSVRFIGQYFLSIKWNHICFPATFVKSRADLVWIVLSSRVEAEAHQRILITTQVDLDVNSDLFAPDNILCSGTCKLWFGKYWRLPTDILKLLPSKRVCVVGMGRFAELMTESEYDQMALHMDSGASSALNWMSNNDNIV